MKHIKFNIVSKKKYFLCFFIFSHFMLLIAQNDGLQFKSQIFEQGNVSTEAVEYSLTFSPSGSEIYFSRSNDKWASGKLKSSIYYSFKKDNKWSRPKLVSFSGQYNDSSPHITHNGKTIYFISKRPSKAKKMSSDIWVTKKNKKGNWSTPVRLDEPINSSSSEYSPRTDKEGNLYFASNRPGGYGQGDIYISRNKNGKLSPPVNMGNSINSSTGEWNLEINDNGKLLIFEASQRKHNVSSFGDLYISFKRDNVWTIPQNIKELNTSGSDLYPELTKQEEELYYTSSDSLKSKNTEIYYTRFKHLHNKYKNQAKVPTQYLLTVNRSSHDLSLINLSDQKLIKRIPVGIGPHEVSVSKDNKYAFVANYGTYPRPHRDSITPKQLEWIQNPQNTIAKVDLSNLNTTTFSIPKSSSHHGILTNHNGSIVWVTAQNEGVVKEINGKDGKVLKEYPTMKGSHILRSTNDFSKIFVSNIESNTISVIDRQAQKVTNIKTHDGPEGMEISPDGEYLWVLCNKANKIMIFNTKSLVLVKIFDSRGKFPVKLTFVEDEVWVVNVFSQNISIFDSLTFEHKENMKVESSPLGITSDNKMVLITLPRKNLVRVYDFKSRKKVVDYFHGMEQDGLFLITDIESILNK